MAGPLENIRILDLSRVLAGPWASQVLADMGADVIKVEKPIAGDDTRAWGPPFLKDKEGNETAESAYFLSTNRNKRSIALDMKTEEGQDILKKLAAKADVVLENFRTGGLKAYGLDYESLKKDHPGLVYCSVTGFGQTGPRKDQAGYDFIIQGMGGLMSITGTDKTGPLKTGVAITDITTGLYTAIAILGALVHRQVTGEGQYIDMALFDTQVSWLANQNMNYLIGGASPVARGNAHPNIVPYQDFKTSDGHITIAAGNNDQFARLVKALGLAELADDARYQTNRDRVKNREQLVSTLAQATRQKTSKELLATLEAEHLPCGSINTIGEAFDDAQTIARNMRLELPHPLSGTVPQVATPIKYSETELEYKSAPPTLGQHTDQVLAELGISEGEIAALKKKGVVA